MAVSLRVQFRRIAVSVELFEINDSRQTVVQHLGPPNFSVAFPDSEEISLISSRIYTCVIEGKPET
jgi:hypothetical protein